MPTKRFPLPSWLRVQLLGLIVGRCDHNDIAATTIEYLIAENQILRGKFRTRPKLTWPERLRLSALARKLGHTRLRTICSIADPKTVIGWLKRWQNSQINQASERGPGRPRISDELREAIIGLHHAGFRSLRGIRGELLKCDRVIAHSTIAQVLKREGIYPDPDKRSTWPETIKRHAHLLMGVDFLTVPVGLFGKVVGCHALIGIEHDTRRLHLLGMTPHPDGQFMQQVAREATTFDGPLANRKMVILDNDTLFTKAFRGTIADADCEVIRTTIMAPNMNAHAERVIQSIKTECLDHFVFLNETMLRRALSEYIAHYNSERPHQGLDQRTVTAWPHHGNTGDIVIDERLGGLLKSARRLAA